MALATVRYDWTAGKTTTVTEWVFILWQLWSYTYSVHCAASTERP